MAIHSGKEWEHYHPGSPCLFAVDRWAVRFMSTRRSVQVKGISRTDAFKIARDHMGRVYRCRVWVFADGTEQLDPWEEVDPWMEGH